MPFSPATAMPIGTPPSGTSQIRAESTRKYWPSQVVRSPVCSSRMIVAASTSMSWRWSTGGQPSPVTCSLRFSPEPSPRMKRPSDRSCNVAAFCATTAGW